MGQKIHPQGLRVGIHRKWSSSWLGFEKDRKNVFFQQMYIEDMLKSFLFFFIYERVKRKFFLFDVKMYKFGSRQSFIFVFYYKKNKNKRQKFSLRTQNRFSLKAKIKRRIRLIKMANIAFKLKEKKNFLGISNYRSKKR